MNHIMLHGRLGRDPEVVKKDGKNGTFKVATFSLAVDRDFGDETDWFRCEVVGKSADTVDLYLKKGKPVIVSGQMESYKTKDDRTGWKVKVKQFWFEKGEGRNTEHAPKNQPDPGDSFEDIDEDVPF